MHKSEIYVSVKIYDKAGQDRKLIAYSDQEKLIMYRTLNWLVNAYNLVLSSDYLLKKVKEQNNQNDLKSSLIYCEFDTFSSINQTFGGTGIISCTQIKDETKLLETYAGFIEHYGLTLRGSKLTLIEN